MTTADRNAIIFLVCFACVVIGVVGVIIYKSIQDEALKEYQTACECWLHNNDHKVKVVTAKNIDDTSTEYVFYGIVTQDCRKFVTKLSPTPPEKTVWRVYWTPTKNRMWFYKL